MKIFLLSLALTGLFSACQSKKSGQTVIKMASPDTTAVVDDDTLESTTDGRTIDSTIGAVATLPDPATPNAVSAGAAADNFYIVPGGQVGPITPVSSEASLIQLVGKSNVTREAIGIGGGDTEPGTTLFKGTANEVHILWKDKKRSTRPGTVLIEPTRDETKAKNVVPNWLVDNGLKIGSTLKDVELINGRPFKLYGFEWNMGGSFTDAQGGKLQRPDGSAYLGFTFGLGTTTPAQAKLIDLVKGDKEFSSSIPAMQTLNPTVETIRIRFK